MKWLALVALVACGGSKGPPPDGTGGPAIGVIASYPGAAPQAVETLVVTPLERALLREPGVSTIRSLSSTSEGRVVVWFEPGTDPVVAARHAAASVTAIRAQLPAEVDTPAIVIGDPDAPPDLAYVVRSDALPVGDVSELLARDVTQAVAMTPGVRRVEVTGARPRQLQIVVDASRVRATGVTHDEVIATVAAAERSSVEEVGNLVVAQLSHVPVLVRDVAELRVELAPSSSAEPLGIAIWWQQPSDGRDLEAVLQDRAPAGVRFDPAPPRSPRARLAIELVGDDLAALEAVADSLASDLADIARVVREPASPSDRSVQVAFEKAALARLAVPAASAAAVSRAFARAPVRTRDLPIVVEIGDTLEGILVRATDGAAIPLDMVATLETRPAPPIVHVNGRRAVVLGVELMAGGSASDVQALLDKHPRIAHRRDSEDPRARLVTRKQPQ